MKILRLFKTILLFFLHWCPRIMCILLAAFPMLFTFEREATFWKTLIDVLIHLIPAFLVILLLMLSWKWPWVGGVSFIILGFVYLIWYYPSSQSHALVIFLFITGILFLADWILRKKVGKADTYN
jgi:hypothetical protein